RQKKRRDNPTKDKYLDPRDEASNRYSNRQATVVKHYKAARMDPRPSNRLPPAEKAHSNAPGIFHSPTAGLRCNQAIRFRTRSAGSSRNKVIRTGFRG